MTVIENEFLKVSIRSQGAEMVSVYNKQAGIEHLWQADPKIWGWHAPNLFPVVGGLIDNQLHVDGKSYPMQRHGFTRPSEFKLSEATRTHALFSLPYSENTLSAYPYKFNFQIIYDLIDNALRVTYKVINHDQQPIYFSVGGHPAFNVPFNGEGNYQDYYLEFETTENLHTHMLSADGFFTGETRPVALDGNKLHLNHDLFKDDALVFKDLKSRMVTIKSDKHPATLSVEFPHFNYLGIWAKPGADFVCIEPWLGCADTEGKPVDIKEKEAIQKLVYGHVFEAAYYISI
ncbi:aldose 1-epimerase family protein [Mucilaginibacter sp. KACC 22063]|uniref:aldose 1-epimerase family protein n=1 Tax=Mucilaginibacter sp. KACC 22063 TaxID=3025666 RepID=UPI0023672567|nr:aldose 1-epimerase family protein [Mucilaginibacter sp. KACC 22063]WDF54581.1 aldose 1-epimerase family protein [Mucilaginibacter sp. KACC 22063]